VSAEGGREYGGGGPPGIGVTASVSEPHAKNGVGLACPLSQRKSRARLGLVRVRVANGGQVVRIRDRVVPTSWPRFLMGAGLVLTITFTLLAPNVSDGLTGVRLFLFWAAHVFGALLILQGVQVLLVRIAAVSALSPWLQVAASGLIGAAIFAPVASLLDQMFGMDAVTDDQGEALLALLVGEFTGLVGPVTVVWIGLNASRLLQISAPERSVESPAADREPAFWELVPRAIGRDIVALGAELHYLRVHTTRGQALILFPFGQAIGQVQGVVDGVQIHRSYWVALAHVAKLERSGQGGLCTTTTGLELPVSRKRVADLKSSMTSAS
jgi:hypothetical protein